MFSKPRGCRKAALSLPFCCRAIQRTKEEPHGRGFATAEKGSRRRFYLGQHERERRTKVGVLRQPCKEITVFVLKMKSKAVIFSSLCTAFLKEERSWIKCRKGEDAPPPIQKDTR